MKSLMRWALLLSFTLTACGDGHVALAPRLPSGETRVGRVTRSTELIGGPIAQGQVRRAWKLYNARAQFVVQDVDTSVGLSLYGGNLIDADVVRDDGAKDHDLFRETFPIVGLRVQRGTRVEVISQGGKDQPAHLRVRGSDAATGILGRYDALALELGGEITTDYILAPDVPYLEIKTTYRAREGQSVQALGFGDFVAFGKALQLFAPENGFAGENPTVSFIAATAERAAYAYVYPDGPLQLLIVDASGMGFLPESHTIEESGEASFTRYLVVGEGGVASVSGEAYRLRGVATGRLSGFVRDELGEPISGARVTLFHAPWDAVSPAVDQAITRANGGYSFDVPAGRYVAIASSPGRNRGKPIEVEVTVAAAANLDLPMSGRGRVELDIGEWVGDQRIGAPAKISMASVTAERPDPRLGAVPAEDERYGQAAVGFTTDGTGMMEVKPGTYSVTLSRGIEYELTRIAELVVPDGGVAQLRADLRRSVDTAGWIAADLHQHTHGSIDGEVSPRDRLIENVVEGIEFPVATDHDNIIDFADYIAELGVARFVNSVAGDEISVNAVGHFNVYPLSVDPADPYRRIGAKLWALQPLDRVFADLRLDEAPRDIIVHVSHPRTRTPSGYFNEIHFDPTTGTADASLETFDALEINGDLGDPEDYAPERDEKWHALAQSTVVEGIPAMRDWFALLNTGRTIAALGNSDVHGRNEGTGYPRTFLFVGSDDPALVDGPLLVSTIRAQRVAVSGGALVTLKGDGIAAMGHTEPRPVVSGSVAIEVEVRSPSWIPMSRVELYCNGRLVAAAPAPDDGARFVRTFVLHPTEDAWCVGVARGEGSLEPVVDLRRPFGVSAPIYLDVDANGWTAPGLGVTGRSAP